MCTEGKALGNLGATLRDSKSNIKKLGVVEYFLRVLQCLKKEDKIPKSQNSGLKAWTETQILSKNVLKECYLLKMQS